MYAVGTQGVSMFIKLPAAMLVIISVCLIGFFLKPIDMSSIFRIFSKLAHNNEAYH